MTTPIVKNMLIPPQTVKEEYTENERVRWVIATSNSVLPGSWFVQGQDAVFTDVANDTSPTQSEDLRIDHLAATEAYAREFSVNFRSAGNVTTEEYYPIRRRLQRAATTNKNSLGTETSNCIVGCAPNGTVAHGYSYGDGSKANGYRDFAFKPDFALNKVMSAKTGEPAVLPGKQTGTITVEMRLPPNREVVQGTNATNLSGYKLKNLMLGWKEIPDDGTRQDLIMETIEGINTNLINGSETLATFVANPTDSFWMCTIPTSKQTNVTQNYIQAEPVPGIPRGSTDNAIAKYGFSKINFSINDTNTSLSSYDFQSRNEILYNFLNAIKHPNDRNMVSLEQVMGADPDLYGVGIRFGRHMDFRTTKFSLDTESSIISGDYQVYMFFRSIVSLPAGNSALNGMSS